VWATEREEEEEENSLAPRLGRWHAHSSFSLSPPPLSSLRATHLATMAFAVAKSAALTTKVATTKRASAVKPVAAFSAER